MSQSSPELAATFQYAGVAAAYRHRPPYPAEVFDVLTGLIVGEPRRVLDLGAGEGALARPLAERVDRVDAVEIAPAMVAGGRQRPGGERDNLHWRVEPAESMDPPGPYALVTAGASLHWMDWDVTLARVAGLLIPGGMLAIVEHSYHRPPWQDVLLQVIIRHSRHPNYDPAFSLPEELERRGLYEVAGRHTTTPTAFRQSVEDYVEQFHSTASLARELMSPGEADAFAAEVRAVLSDYQDDEGHLDLQVAATIVWGRPVVAEPR